MSGEFLVLNLNNKTCYFIRMCKFCIRELHVFSDAIHTMDFTSLSSIIILVSLLYFFGYVIFIFSVVYFLFNTRFETCLLYDVVVVKYCNKLLVWSIIIINLTAVNNNIFVYAVTGKSLKFPAHNRSVNNNTVGKGM